MAFKKINSKAKILTDTGFGKLAANYGGRFVGKDGLPNVKKTGVDFWERYSWFHGMLEISRWHFFLIILLFFIVINLVFAVIYYSLGVNHLAGMNVGTEWEKFGEAFFFSTQTFTTVGYGRISPTGFVTSAISSIQALMGLLSFAVATGLMYGRFSLPRAYLKFSKTAIIAPFKNGQALMVRVAPYKNTVLTDAECRLTLGLIIDEDGKKVNRFYPLDLEYSKVNALTLSWTIVHPIDETSPLYNFTEQDFANNHGEVIVFIKAFDDKFSNTVVSRSSYTFEEINYGARFKPMFHRDHDQAITVLELDKISETEPAAIAIEERLG
jgi:inward rectifier potassium channel